MLVVSFCFLTILDKITIFLTLVIHGINQIMNGWWLKYGVSKFVVLIYLFYVAVGWVSMKSHQSNQKPSATWRTSKSCKYSSFYSML